MHALLELGVQLGQAALRLAAPQDLDEHAHVVALQLDARARPRRTSASATAVAACPERRPEVAGDEIAVHRDRAAGDRLP